jgi:hypothetical protein
VTEAKWLACSNPRTMLEFLRGRVSDRKLRLFSCAFCRVLRTASGLGAGTAIAVAERYADGLATDQDLATERRGIPFPDNFAEWSTAQVAYDGAWQPVDWLTGVLETSRIDPDAYRHFPFPVEDNVKYLVLLLRDILGNPFRPVSFDPLCRTSTVNALASGIYGERAYNRLLILADALQDAGCDNDDILNHLRGPGPHTRGCWALDLALGKE